jgi:hypothetical protein
MLIKNLLNNNKNIIAVNSSTIGYCKEILAPQYLHFPLFIK